MKFGENLYNLRKSAKMSQEKLAEKMDVSRQSVSKWENGESYPEMEKIIKLCNIFHCKINDLVHEDMTDMDSLDEDIKMSVVKFKKEKQQKMKGLSKAIYIIARIGKIIVTIAMPLIVLAMIIIPILISKVNIADNQIVFNGLDDKITVVEENNNSKIALKVKFKDTLIADETNQDSIIRIKHILENNNNVTIITYVEVGMACLFICTILYRMILKRLENLFVNIYNGDTPFTLENVKYIKQMAYFMIFSIILPNIGGIAFERILRSDLDVEFELLDVAPILFLFSMAYIFEYGYELQKDSKGKIYGEVENNE